VTRYASEPHRRHVAGVTWTRDDLGRYRCKEGEKEFIAFPVRSGRSGPVSWTLYINGDRASDSWPMRPLDRALGEASKLVRKERFANDPSMQHPSMSYPMLEKLAVTRVRSSVVSAFLDWLKEQDVHLCRPSRGMEPIGDTTENLVARYFGIDMKQVEVERRALLEAQKTVNKKNKS